MRQHPHRFSHRHWYKEPEGVSATTGRLGRFELANGGTISLDEIGEWPLELQAKLLRVIQEGEFERLGGSQTISTNIRIVAATHRDLSKMILTGAFREDLYHRLNVFPVNIPALRERREDIPQLLHLRSRATSRMVACLCAPSKKMFNKWPGDPRSPSMGSPA